MSFRIWFLLVSFCFFLLPHLKQQIIPSHCVSQQSSGSTAPPCQLVPLPVHGAFQRQGDFFNYLVSCHDLWEQADMLVTKGNHTGEWWTKNTHNKFNTNHTHTHTFAFIADFFISLDHENGPITLHSSLSTVVKYVKAGLQKLKLNQNLT